MYFTQQLYKNSDTSPTQTSCKDESVILLKTILKRANIEKSKATEEEARQHYSKEELVRIGKNSPLFKYAL